MAYKSRTRTDLPCGGYILTSYYHTERNPIKFIMWKNADGKNHRVDGPAALWYCRHTGRLEAMEYWQNGRLHRTDGPAVIDFYTTDEQHKDLGLDLQKMTEEWYQDHRMKRDGIYLPAYIEYEQDGRTIKSALYFKGDRQIKDTDLPDDFHQLDPELREFTWELL